MTAVRLAAADAAGSRDQDTGRKQQQQQQQQLVTGPVVIYSVFCLLAVDKHLAADYVYEPFTMFLLSLVFYLISLLFSRSLSP